MLITVRGVGQLGDDTAGEGMIDVMVRQTGQEGNRMVSRKMVTVWLIIWTVLAVWMCRYSVGPMSGRTEGPPVAHRLDRWTGKFSMIMVSNEKMPQLRTWIVPPGREGEEEGKR